MGTHNAEHHRRNRHEAPEPTASFFYITAGVPETTIIAYISPWAPISAGCSIDSRILLAPTHAFSRRQSARDLPCPPYRLVKCVNAKFLLIRENRRGKFAVRGC